MKEEKKIYLEILRIIAFVCVMFNHTGTYGFELFTQDRPMALRILGIVLSDYAKIGVPVFFMISGALLIPRKEDLRTLMIHRVLKMLVILIVISFIYYIRLWLRHPEYGFSIRYFAETIYKSPFVTPLWFMYMYIAFLLMLPFLRRLALNMSGEMYGYMMLLCIVFWYAVPVISFAAGGNAYMNIPLLSMNIVYPLAGYYLDAVFPPDAWKENKIIKKITAIPYVVMLTVTNGLLCVILTCLNAKIRGQWGYEFVESFIFIPAISTFFLVKSLCSKTEISKRFKQAAGYIGGCMFVTYLSEEMLREDICMVIYRTWGGSSADLLLFIPYALILLTLGVVLTTLIRLVPGLKNWV